MKESPGFGSCCAPFLSEESGREEIRPVIRLLAELNGSFACVLLVCRRLVEWPG